jgi:hypothetical protein
MIQKIKELKIMQLLDVYTKKEYTCPVCNAAVYYAKIADNSGKLVTTDGQPPNGVYGKGNNVLSGAVDANVKDRLHNCTAEKTTKKYQELTQEPLANQAINSPNYKPPVKPKVVWNASNGETAVQKLLKDGYKEINDLAYHLTLQQHPEMSDQDGLFGQIVSAKSTVLSNLLIAESLKRLREQYDLAHNQE